MEFSRKEWVPLVGVTMIAGIALTAFATGLGFDRPWPFPGRVMQPTRALNLLAMALGIGLVRRCGKKKLLRMVPPLAVLGLCAAALAMRSEHDGILWAWSALVVPDHAMKAAGMETIPASDLNIAAMVVICTGTMLSALRRRWANIAADVATWSAIAIGVSAIGACLLPPQAGFSGLGHRGEQIMGLDIAAAYTMLGIALGVARGRIKGSAFSVLFDGGHAGILARRNMLVAVVAPVAAVWSAGYVLSGTDLSPAMAPILVTGLLTLVLGTATLALVTRFRSAEENLRKAKDEAVRAAENLQLAMELGHIATWERDVSTGRIHRSESLYSMYGLPRQVPEVDASYWKAIIHPEDKPFVIVAREALSPSNTEYNVTHRIVRATDGEVRHVRVAARWLPGGTDGGGRIVGMVNDVTEQMLLAATAEQANAEKSKLIAAIAHDLRQPLQGLMLHLGVLSTSLAAAPGTSLRIRNSLSACHEATGALGRMLDGMLAIGRAGAVLEPLHVKSVSVASVLRDLCREYAPRAAAHGIDLRSRAPAGNALPARTDPILLERILRNLVENAIKHTPAGGRILISGRSRETGPLIEVWDTGRGIPRDALSTIWDEMRQVSPSDRGHGIGLSTVRRLATRLGCGLGVSSVQRRGSRFWLRVPTDVETLPAEGRGAVDAVTVPREAPRAEGEQAATRSIARPVVILVDDDHAVMAGLSILMDGWGIQVHEASDAEEARQVAMHLREAGVVPDALVTDFRLPDASGLKVIETVREIFVAPVPAAMLTAEGGETVRSQAAISGARLLSKPITVPGLREALVGLGVRVPPCEGSPDGRSLRLVS